jgi:adenosylhomocysteinase
MAADGALAYQIITVNEADTKHLFDNRYGTGRNDRQDNARRTCCGRKTIVVCGYGWYGRGVACGRTAEAHVVVTEVNPVRALEAVMDGHRVSGSSTWRRKGTSS